MMVMGPGMVIFTGVSVIAWALFHSSTTKGAAELGDTLPLMVGTWVLQAPLRYSLYVSSLKSKLVIFRLLKGNRKCYAYVAWFLQLSMAKIQGVFNEFSSQFNEFSRKVCEKKGVLCFLIIVNEILLFLLITNVFCILTFFL